MMAPADASPYHEVLRRIAAEVWVTSKSEYAHEPGATELPPMASHGLPLRLAAPSCPEALQQNLSQFLYAYYYFGDPSEAKNAQRQDFTPLPIALREDATFGAALRRANRGKGYADPGWRVTAREGEAALVEKNRVSLLAGPGDLAGEPPNLAPGAEVALRFPNDRPYAYPGYYMAVGDGGPATAELRRQVVRIYFDVRPEGAPALLSALTSGMGATLTRFCVKVLNNPSAYTRSDAAVAYLMRDEYPRARGMLADVVGAIRHHLGERVPAFARAIAAGVGVAEEPAPDGPARLSFGQHRCLLVARGLARASDAGAEDAPGRLRYILRELEAAGVDAARPYLNPGSTDLYASLDDTETARRLPRGAQPAAVTTSDGE